MLPPSPRLLLRPPLLLLEPLLDDDEPLDERPDDDEELPLLERVLEPLLLLLLEPLFVVARGVRPSLRPDDSRVELPPPSLRG